MTATTGVYKIFPCLLSFKQNPDNEFKDLTPCDIVRKILVEKLDQLKISKAKALFYYTLQAPVNHIAYVLVYVMLLIITIVALPLALITLIFTKIFRENKISCAISSFLEKIKQENDISPRFAKFAILVITIGIIFLSIITIISMPIILPISFSWNFIELVAYTPALSTS